MSPGRPKLRYSRSRGTSGGKSYAGDHQRGTAEQRKADRVAGHRVHVHRHFVMHADRTRQAE